MNSLKSLRPASNLELGWLESLQPSPFPGYRFVAADVRGPNPGIYLFARNGRRSKLVSIQASSPSGIGLNARGISTLVDVEGHQLRRWFRGEEISPVVLAEHGVRFPNDARRDLRTGLTVGGSVGTSLDAVASPTGAIVDQPLWLVRSDGHVSLSKEVYTCLNGVAFGAPGKAFSAESFGDQRLVEFIYDEKAIVQSEREVYSFISNPDGISSFEVDGKVFLAVSHPFTYEVSILDVNGSEVRQAFVITSTEGVGMPITPVVEVHGSTIIVTSVVTRPGAPNMFNGSKSGLAWTKFDASLLR